MTSVDQPGRSANSACLDDVGLGFAFDLHKRLVDVLRDAAPPEAHVSRLVRTPPKQPNLATLEAPCIVLACGPADLLQHRPVAATPEVAR